MRHLLTVVIPSWNNRELLKRCLASMRNQSVVPELLVVDDGSTDGTSEMLASEFPEVRVVRQPEVVGFAAAVNSGILACRTPYVALLNNDTEADPGWAEAGLRAMEDQPDYAFFACKMIQFDHPTLLDSAGDCYNRAGMPYKRGMGKRAELFSAEEEVLGAGAGAAFYRKSLFEEIGLFDESYGMYLEDVELSLRARWMGYRCLYLPYAVVYHIEAASDPELSSRKRVPGGHHYSKRRVFLITRNRWKLMVTYQPLRNAPWLLAGWTKSALFHLLKAGYFVPFCQGVLAGVLETGRSLRRRSQWNKKRRLDRDQICQLIQKC